MTVVAGAALPLLYLAVRAIEGGVDQAAEILSDPSTLALLLRTLGLAISVTLASLVIAIPIAWFTTRTNLPGRRILAVLTALPLVIPSYVGAYAAVSAFGPKGMVQKMLIPLGVERLPELYGFPGALVILTLYTYPYLLLTVSAAMKGLDPSIEEAARTLGKSPSQVFFKVILPQLRPSAGSGALLVALYTIHDFGAVSLLRFDTFTRAIHLAYQGSFDRSRAAVLSLCLILLAGILVLIEGRTRKRIDLYRLHSGGARAVASVSLGAWRWVAGAFCALVAGAALAGPLVVMGVWLSRALSLGGPDWARAFDGLGGSLQAATLGTLFTLAGALPVAVVAQRDPSWIGRRVEQFGYIGHVLPGLVVGLSLVFIGVRLVPAIYQTRAMLAFSYGILFLPLAVGSIRASLGQVSPRLEEASRSLGRGYMGTVKRVTMPLTRPGVGAGAALVFLSGMKELPATIMTSPPGFTTLATHIWSSTTEARFSAAALPGLLLIICSSVPLAFLLMTSAASGRGE